jgi:hypothetical protein
MLERARDSQDMKQPIVAEPACPSASENVLFNDGLACATEHIGDGFGFADGGVDGGQRGIDGGKARASRLCASESQGTDGTLDARSPLGGHGPSVRQNDEGA